MKFPQVVYGSRVLILFSKAGPVLCHEKDGTNPHTLYCISLMCISILFCHIRLGAGVA